MNLLNMLTGAMKAKKVISSLSNASGGSSDQVSGLIDLAMPLLMQSLTSNASSQSGAQSLLGALSQHTNTASITDQIMSADTADGSAILGHIFGENEGQVVQSLSQDSGMNSDQVMSVLSSIAPALLSGLSAATQTAQTQQAANSGISADSLDLSDLMGMLGGAAPIEQSKPAGGMDGTALLGLLMNMMK